MRALTVHILGDIDSTRVDDRPDPVPGPGQVLVEVHHAPVNYVDLVTLRGEYQFRPEVPYIPGKGPSGVIRSVGPGVDGFSIGDRILAMAEYGGHAELVAVDQEVVHRVPARMDLRDAAAMSLGFDTAWMALHDRARLSSGESVLILGATGTVGRAAVQLARAAGAGLVLGGVSRPGRDAGPVDGIVDLGRPDLHESVRQQVLAETDGRGIDVVVDMLGGDPFDGAVRSLAWRGRLVVVGFAAGRIPELRMNYPLLKNIEISGLQISDYRKRRPDLVAECYRDVFGLFEAGAITPPKSAVFPLSGWRRAYDDVASRSALHRILLDPQ